MKNLKFAIFGTGFWSQFQFAPGWNWKAFECVALYSRTLSKAATLAERFHISHTYDDPEELFCGRNSLILWTSSRT
ncbi:MAG: hypothetical protein U5K79_24105 [Cyclobacteriaceae bacterium]|nr:hypothetical protein [Cyclobacteriaceae bacterium]